MEVFDMTSWLNYIVRDNPVITYVWPKKIYIPPPPPPPPVKKGVLDGIIFEPNMTSCFVRLAGLSGALAVGLGAYGAHKSYPKANEEELKQIFATANRYHFLHSLALLGMPLVRHPIITGSLMLTGMVLFCGPCYQHSLSGEPSPYNKIVPVGGTILILAWLSIAF